jgi:hypothetical protein
MLKKTLTPERRNACRTSRRSIKIVFQASKAEAFEHSNMFERCGTKNTMQLTVYGTGARFGDSFGLGREALLIGHNCPVFDRCQTA